MNDNQIGAIFSGVLTIILGITMCTLSMQIDDIQSLNTASCSTTLKIFNKILLIAGSALSSFGLLFFILSFGHNYINSINGNVYLIYFFLVGLLLSILSGQILTQDDCNDSKQSATALLIVGIILCFVSILWLSYRYYFKLNKKDDIFPELDLKFNRFA